MSDEEWFPDLDIADVWELFLRVRKTYFPGLEFINDQFSE